MNRRNKILFALVALCVLLSGISMESMASAPKGEEGGYSYRITLYAGKQGEFTEEGIAYIKENYSGAKCNTERDKIVIPNVAYGEPVHLLDPQSLVRLPEGSKYYVKGIRLSARDNNTAEMEKTYFETESDVDYVIAYGVIGDMVAYQVNYQDEAGNTLAPSVTYYGNVGDKPVVAFLYIEGYVPQAYNLTRTLQKDASKNVFTFVYRRGETGTTTTTVIDDGTTVITLPGDTTTTDGAGGNQGAGADGNAGTGTEDIQDEQVPMAPSEMIDLDDEKVPLASLRDLIINPDGRFIYGSSILVGVTAAALLLGMGIISWRKRRAENLVYEELDKWDHK